MTIHYCDQCSYSSYKLRYVKLHQMSKHNLEKPFKCETCNKYLSSNQLLADHVNTHLNMKPYLCDFENCGKSFFTLSNLCGHKKRHSDIKPFICDFEDCTASFFFMKELKIHERIHTGETPYHCNFEGCVCAYNTRSGLVVHRRCHTGERPYKCSWEGCNYASTTTESLKVHLRQHTGERPYKCNEPNCSAAFVCPTNLKTHKFNHHTEEGRQLQKKQEMIIDKMLTENKIDFKREHRIDFKCIGRTHANIDFLIMMNGVMIYLEVDETQHDWYPLSCEVRRMSDVFGSMVIEGITMPGVFIRYNPHAYKIDGVTQRIKMKERHTLLLQAIEKASTATQNQIMYLFYDLDENNRPCVLSDPDYDESIEEMVV